MPSIQSCELSRLDLKGVSLVSIVAGSWPLVCFTAELVDVCKTNQTNSRVLRVCFAFWACLKFERFERIHFCLQKWLEKFCVLFGCP